jgi:hypothetical protein
MGEDVEWPQTGDEGQQRQLIRHSGTRIEHNCWCRAPEAHSMNNIIYIIGLIVVVLAILAFFGLR